MEILKPVFIVGSGRSGTTILYNLLAGHKQLGWFSNYTDRYYKRPELAWLNNIYKKVALSSKFRQSNYFPKPSEGHNIWDLFHPINGSRDDGSSPPFTETDVKNANKTLMSSTIIKHLESSNSTRFLNKNTRNTRRIPYLYEIFPDSLFIHLIRDGRANVNSLMNVEWWKDLVPWFIEAQGKNVQQLVEEGHNEYVLASNCWKKEVMIALESSKNIPKKQYLEIKYEELTQDPKSVIEKILSFIDLEFNDHFVKHLNSFTLKNMNYKYAESFTDSELELVENEIRDLLKTLNYE